MCKISRGLLCALASGGRRALPGLSARYAILIAVPILIAAAPVTTSGTLRVIPDRILATFRPAEAFGVDVDGGSPEEAAALLSPKNSSAIRAAHFKSVSYRLRTELAGEVWHWTSFGRWSDQAGHQGYWTGDPSRDDNQEMSFGYRLPRRGNSRDEADDDGFSRIDDGDPSTFWKSNPYLDPELDGLGVEEQWVIVDLGRNSRIDTAQIHWGEPYAARFRLQRWVGSDPYGGKWRDLTPTLRGHPGAQTVRFDFAAVRFVRILLERSSHTSTAAAQDRRDAMGYAIREIGLGTSEGSVLHDVVRHQPSGRSQTQIMVSSTDPWHREIDLDAETVQPSPLRLHDRGLFAGPFMMPLGLLTDTPENAIAELHYFRRRGLPIEGVELGEEPEGQLAPPKMVAALYRRLALKIATQAQGLPIGGPSLIDPVADTTLDDENESWTKAFLQSVRQGPIPLQMSFVSTELYPVENLCERPVRMLDLVSRAPRTMAARFRDDGAGPLSRVITEYGLSPYGGRALLGIVSALADADILARSLSQGVGRLYLYGTSPTSAVHGKRKCAGSGNLTLWNSDQFGHGLSNSVRLRVFEALRDQWSNPEDAREQLLAISGAPAGIDAFALRREDGSMSILLINRKPHLSHVRWIAPVSTARTEFVRTTMTADTTRASSASAVRTTKTKGFSSADLGIEPLSITILDLRMPVQTRRHSKGNFEKFQARHCASKDLENCTRQGHGTIPAGA